MKKVILQLCLLIFFFFSFSETFAAACDAVYADNTVVLASVGKKLYRSTDGGISFSHVLMAGDDDVEVRCITKINSTLLAGGINGKRVYRSTDNGASWSVANSGMPMISGVVVSVPAYAITVDTKVFMGGTNFSKYTDDEGLTWTDIPVVPGATHGLKYTGGKIWHSNYSHMRYSSDKGITWTATTATPWFGGGSAVAYIQRADTILALSNLNGGYALHRSGNTGASWSITGSLSLGLDMVEFGGNLYATSYDGFMKSTDGGHNWNKICDSFKYYAYGGKMSVHNDDIWIASGNGLLKYNGTSNTCTKLAVETSSAVKEYNAGGAISVYPNPGQDLLHLKNLPDNASVELMDMNGRLMLKVQHKKEAILSLNISSFPSGIYLCKVAGAEVQYAKVMIAK